jgi:hypothetical protein
MVRVQRGQRAPQRLVERPAIVRFPVVRLGIAAGRRLVAVTLAADGRWPPAQVHGRAGRDHPDPATERAVAVVLGDLRRRARAPREELVPELLPDLVDEGQGRSEPPELRAQPGEVRALEGLDGAADAATCSTNASIPSAKPGQARRPSSKRARSAAARAASPAPAGAPEARPR